MFAQHLRPQVRTALLLALSAFCIARIAIVPLQFPFNGLLANWLHRRQRRYLGIHPSRPALLSQPKFSSNSSSSCWRSAAYGRFSGAPAYALIAWAHSLPERDAWRTQLLLILVLLPLAWTRAGWVLSLTILSAYAAGLFATPAAPLLLPRWLIFAAMLPVLVVELEELTVAALNCLKPRSAPVVYA